MRRNQKQCSSCGGIITPNRCSVCGGYIGKDIKKMKSSLQKIEEEFDEYPEETKEKFYGHPKFFKIIEELKGIHHRKNFDYAGDKDPLFNLRLCEEMDIPAWKGVVVRLSDKYARLINYAKNEELKNKNEGIIDTLNDMATYSILCRILFEEYLKKKK